MYRYAPELFGYHSICSRISGKMKVLQRKVLTLMAIRMLPVFECTDSIGLHSVTNGFGVPRVSKIQNMLKL